MSEGAELIRAAAKRVADEEVNLGGFPYEGGIDPQDALRSVAGPRTEELWSYIVCRLERGMTTGAVVQEMNEAADYYDRCG